MKKLSLFILLLITTSCNNIKSSEMIPLHFDKEKKVWRDGYGICHTCTEENGFTKDGKVILN